MRYVLAALTLTATLYLSVSAQAETRVFIFASNADGYGIDRCLATGAACGAAVAAAYCRAREFSQVASYRRVDREEVTGGMPPGAAACRSGGCDEFVAIECAR
jgi:hypothetical protein